MVEELKKLISNEEGIGDTLIRIQNGEEFDKEIEEQGLVCEACGGDFKPVCFGDECYDECIECGLISH